MNDGDYWGEAPAQMLVPLLFLQADGLNLLKRSYMVVSRPRLGKVCAVKVAMLSAEYP